MLKLPSNKPNFLNNDKQQELQEYVTPKIALFVKYSKILSAKFF